MIMDNLTAGEYIQAIKNRNFSNMDQLLSDYLIKSYYKTASLMAHSCRGVSLLNGKGLGEQEKCFRIGQHLGIAFQLIDDILDFTVSSEELGKNSLSDVKEGHLNGPVLFAVQELGRDKEKEGMYEEMTGKLAQKMIGAEDLMKGFFGFLDFCDFCNF